MKLRRLLIIAVLLAIFMIGAVSASDNETMDDLSIELSLDDVPLEFSGNTDDNLSAGKGNFAQLNDVFENAKRHSEVKLEKDYVYYKKTDSEFKEGLKIKKSLTVNGQGHEISGNGLVLGGSDVIIKNVVFKNANIDSFSVNCEVINCTFSDCSFEGEHSAIDAHGGLNVDSCNFINCHFEKGSAICLGGDCGVSNSNFLNCSSEYGSGAAVYIYYGSDCDIVNCSFERCSAWNGGAICDDFASSSEVIGCDFRNCSGENCGGAIYSYSLFNIDSCSFIDCFGRYDDAIYFTGEFNLKDSSFVGGAWRSDKSGKISNISVDGVFYDLEAFEDLKENSTVSLEKDYLFFSAIQIDKDNVVIDGKGHLLKGGRIFSITGKNVTISNCHFANSSSRDYGGVIYCEAINCRIVNCTFNDCSVSYAGGAVYSKRNAIVENCSFVNCSASYGGALYFDGIRCKVVGCSFVNCSADYRSKAIHFEKDFVLENSSFVDGAWYSKKAGSIRNVSIDGIEYDVFPFDDLKENSRVNLTRNCLIFATVKIAVNNIFIDGGGNHILGNGNTIFSVDGDNVTIANFKFANSSISDSVIRIKGLNSNIINCTFTDCASDDYASAIYVDGDNCSILSCTFVECRAYDGLNGMGDGGAIYCKGDSCRIADCRFTDCDAPYAVCGGAVYFAGHGCSVSNCSFDGCSVASYSSEQGYGGAVYSRFGFSAINSTFSNCNADYGGAVYSNDDFNVIGCSFSNCSGNSICWLDFEVYYGSYFRVKIIRPEGTVASGVSVEFKLDGKKLKTVKTDNGGYAKVQITSLPGNHKIQAKALGKTASEKIMVKKVLSLKKVKVKRSAKKLVLTATLKKVDGKYLKGKKIAFKFNGKKYSVKTDKKGVAKLTIKKSQLKKLKAGKKVKYQATYIKSTVKYTVKVSK